MIGTQDEAQVALTLNEGGHYPTGWFQAGAGCSRVAFRSPSGTIYKVGYSGASEENINEYECVTSLSQKPLPEGWALPEVALFDVEGTAILAMEDCGDERYYYRSDEDGDGTGETYTFFQETFGVHDPHGGNLRVKNGVKYCIDFGYSAAAGRYNEDGMRTF